jgi:hypothetical protein
MSDTANIAPKLRFLTARARSPFQRSLAIIAAAIGVSRHAIIHEVPTIAEIETAKPAGIIDSKIAATRSD